jgi:hypothetical protein
MSYKKTQMGWLVIAFMLPIIIYLAVLFFTQWGDNPIPFLPFILITFLFLVAILLFYKLTVEINGSTLTLTYGIGIIKFRFEIDQLLSVEQIKTPWYYGLGIRVTPKGMLYNIHGLKAVAIKYFRNGKEKSVMVGTDEPGLLAQAIKLNFRKNPM